MYHTQIHTSFEKEKPKKVHFDLYEDALMCP